MDHGPGRVTMELGYHFPVPRGRPSRTVAGLHLLPPSPPRLARPGSCWTGSTWSQRFASASPPTSSCPRSTVAHFVASSSGRSRRSCKAGLQALRPSSKLGSSGPCCPACFFATIETEPRAARSASAWTSGSGSFGRERGRPSFRRAVPRGRSPLFLQLRRPGRLPLLLPVQRRLGAHRSSHGAPPLPPQRPRRWLPLRPTVPTTPSALG